MTHSKLYRAPFGPGGSAGIDEAVCRRLIEAALSSGGDYADLFFEYRAAGSLFFEDGITKSASRGVSLGLGVRVRNGDATGYAHVEDLDFDAMLRAARTAGQIARAQGPQTTAVQINPRVLPERYELHELTLDVAGGLKRELLERASKAAHAHDPSIVKVEASFSEEIREILVCTSLGHFCRDSQPLMRFGVRALAEQKGRREAGRSGGGGRMTMGYFEGKSPEYHGAEAARQALVLLEAKPAPAGQLTVVLAPGDSGILLHEAVGHGLEADFNRKKTSNYSGQIGNEVASSLCTVVDDATFQQSRGTINVDDEGNEPERSVLIENGILRGYIHDQHSAAHFKTRPTGNGRRESFACVPLPRMTNTLLLAGPHDPEEILRSVSHGIFAKSFGGGQVDIANGDFVFSLTEAI
jgi:TldD protein